MTDREQLLSLLDAQVMRLKVLHFAHWAAAKAYKSKSRWLGIPVVALTTATGTSLFAGLESSSDSWQIAAGVFALAAAVLAGIQTFLNFSEQAAEHQGAAPKWGVLRRQAEMLQASPPELLEELKSELTALNNGWTAIEESVPGVPPRVFEAAEKHYEKTKERAEKEKAVEAQQLDRD